MNKSKGTRIDEFIIAEYVNYDRDVVITSFDIMLISFSNPLTKKVDLDIAFFKTKLVQLCYSFQ